MDTLIDYPNVLHQRNETSRESPDFPRHGLLQEHLPSRTRRSHRIMICRSLSSGRPTVNRVPGRGDVLTSGLWGVNMAESPHHNWTQQDRRERERHPPPRECTLMGRSQWHKTPNAFDWSFSCYKASSIRITENKLFRPQCESAISISITVDCWLRNCFQWVRLGVCQSVFHKTTLSRCSRPVIK